MEFFLVFCVYLLVLLAFSLSVTLKGTCMSTIVYSCSMSTGVTGAINCGMSKSYCIQNNFKLIKIKKENEFHLITCQVEFCL